MSTYRVVMGNILVEDMFVDDTRNCHVDVYL